MSRKAHPTIIGAFVLSALTLLFIAIIIFGSKSLFKPVDHFILYFEDSVNGLDIGAPIKFKGVTIGSVTDIKIHYDQPLSSDAIPIFIEIETEKLRDQLGFTQVDLSNKEDLQQEIDKGLRAKLEMQSYVTGMLFVELNYHKNAPAILLQESGNFNEIPTLRSNIEEIWKSATETLANISQIDFAEISDNIKSLTSNLKSGMAEIEFKRINDSMVNASDGIGKIVNSPMIDKNLNDFNDMLNTITSLTNRLDTQIDPITANLNNSLVDLQDTLTSLKGMFQTDSRFRYEMDKMLREMVSTARALRFLADYTERNPNSFLTGKAKPKETK